MTMFVSYPFRVPATNAPLYWQSAYEPTHRFTYLQFHPEPNEDGIEIDASYAMEEDFSVSVFNERYQGTSLCFPIIPNASLPSIKALAHDAKLEAMLQRISDAYLSEFHEGQWRGSFPGLPEGFEKEVIDHLAEVLSEDALKMVPASTSEVVTWNCLFYVSCCPLRAMQKSWFIWLSMKGCSLWGMWWMKLPSGAPKRSNMTLRRT